MASAVAFNGTTASLHKAIEKKVRYTLNGRVNEGYLYTADPVTQCVVFTNRLPKQTRVASHSMSMVHVGDIEKLEPLDDALEEFAELHSVSKAELLKMEQRNMMLAEEALARIGTNVSAEAQVLFDALCKTMPCEWNGQNIVVMEEVSISPPYQLSDCTSTNDQLLSRVRKVMEKSGN